MAGKVGYFLEFDLRNHNYSNCTSYAKVTKVQIYLKNGIGITCMGINDVWQ